MPAAAVRAAAMMEELERRIERIAADRRHGASALAVEAVEILADAQPGARADMAERLANLRPAMPALAGTVRAAAALADPREILRRVEVEHARVASVAAAAVSPDHLVATLSNSSLVRRVLELARPRRVLVLVEGADDEGHRLVEALGESGITAAAVTVEVTGEAWADVAVVGCDAIFDDGGFVNRRGTARLLAAILPQPMVVVGDRWRRVTGSTPATWAEPELFEVIPPAPSLAVIF